jgi:hypothetical protein
MSNPIPYFDVEAEVVTLKRMHEQLVTWFENYSGPWEIRPSEKVALWCCAEIVAQAINAVQDKELGARLTEDVLDLEPAQAIPGYLQRFAETWLGYVEMDGIAQLALTFGSFEVKQVQSWDYLKVGQIVTADQVVTLKTRMYRTAWRVWQMHVRSPRQEGGKEWFSFVHEFYQRKEYQMRVNALYMALEGHKLVKKVEEEEVMV